MDIDKKYWRKPTEFTTAGTAVDYKLNTLEAAGRAFRTRQLCTAGFQWNQNADADTWLAKFQRYTEYKHFHEDNVAAVFPLFLKDPAIGLYAYETLYRKVKSAPCFSYGLTDLDEIWQNYAEYGSTERTDRYKVEFSQIQDGGDRHFEKPSICDISATL